jgi:hypothetical protein
MILLELANRILEETLLDRFNATYVAEARRVFSAKD